MRHLTSILPLLLAEAAGDAPPPAGAPGAGAPAIPQTPAAPPPGDGAEVKLSSAQLKARLEEERAAGRRALLKEYGLEKQDDLKGRLDRLKALEDEKLSSDERAAKALKEATARAEAGDGHAKTAQEAVTALLATLTDAQRAVVEAENPSSPAEALRLIGIVRKLGGAAPTAPAAPSAPPPPANLGGPLAAPKPGATKTPWERYQDLASKPMSQAAFYRANSREIEASRPA